MVTIRSRKLCVVGLIFIFPLIGNLTQVHAMPRQSLQSAGDLKLDATNGNSFDCFADIRREVAVVVSFAENNAAAIRRLNSLLHPIADEMEADLFNRLYRPLSNVPSKLRQLVWFSDLSRRVWNSLTKELKNKNLQFFDLIYFYLIVTQTDFIQKFSNGFRFTYD